MVCCLHVWISVHLHQVFSGVLCSSPVLTGTILISFKLPSVVAFLQERKRASKLGMELHIGSLFFYGFWLTLKAISLKLVLVASFLSSDLCSCMRFTEIVLHGT